VLTAARARARQEAQQWSADLVKNESDEEREQRKARKAANRKVKSEAPSGDEGLSTPVTGGGGAEPKKKRRKLKKGGSGAASAAASTQVSDAEDGGLFSEGEEEKPVKKVRLFGADKCFCFAYGRRYRLFSVGRQGNEWRVRTTMSWQLLRHVKSNSELSPHLGTLRKHAEPCASPPPPPPHRFYFLFFFPPL
jgi:hypothetical protein